MARAVVDAAAAQRGFRIQQFGVAVLEIVFVLADLEIAVQILESDRARETMPALLRTRGGELVIARMVDVGGLVAIAETEIVGTIVAARLRDPVVEPRFLQSLRVLQLHVGLVAAAC